MKRGKRFTLIELLIVVAIIAILAGMLLPTLQKARDRAKGIKCFGNLKQWGIGAQLYASNYSDYVFRNTHGSTTGSSVSWNHRLSALSDLAANASKYPEESWRMGRSINACDAHTEKTLATPSSIPYPCRYYSYGANYNLTQDSTYMLPKLSRLRNATKVVMLMDISLYTVEGGTNTSSGASGLVITTNADRVGYVHQKMCNALFADGHCARSGRLTAENSLQDPAEKN